MALIVRVFEASDHRLSGSRLPGHFGLCQPRGRSGVVDDLGDVQPFAFVFHFKARCWIVADDSIQDCQAVAGFLMGHRNYPFSGRLTRISAGDCEKCTVRSVGELLGGTKPSWLYLDVMSLTRPHPRQETFAAGRGMAQAA